MGNVEKFRLGAYVMVYWPFGSRRIHAIRGTKGMWNSFSCNHREKKLMSISVFALQFVPIAHALIGLTFIYQHFHRWVLLFIIAKVTSFYFVVRFRMKWPVWLVATFWVLLLNIVKAEQIQEPLKEYLDISETNCYETIIISSWIILKLISFTLDCVQQQSSIDFVHANPFNAFNLLGYVFYFPNMLVGPIIIYRRYANMLKKNVDPLTIHQSGERYARVKGLLLNLLRFGFWLAITDFALHFIYVNNLMYNPQVRPLSAPKLITLLLNNRFSPLIDPDERESMGSLQLWLCHGPIFL